MTLLGLSAQECSSLWLTCPEAYVGQQVVYCHTYTGLPEPEHATITVATTGYFRLYVNGNLVSVPSFPLVRAPYRDNPEATEPITTSFEVSRYLRTDSNSVALLVSPSSLDETPSFSLRLNGISNSGCKFVREADETWICRPQNAFLTDTNSEYVDGANMIGSFDEMSADGIMKWLPAERVAYCSWTDVCKVFKPSYEYIYKVEKPKFFSADWNAKGISYDFGKGFYGLVRVTLRETKRGQHIYIAGSEYICTGRTDEQFVLRFAVSGFRKVYISGDKHFRLKNISKVEGLQIVPKFANNYSI